MSKLLPETQKVRVTQTFAQPSGAVLESFDQVIILLPEKAPAKVWKSVPDSSRLKKLLEQQTASRTRFCAHT